MERAKQLGKIDARCILETAGHLIDHASRVTYELRGVAIAIHLNGVDSCQRLCDSLGDLRHDIDVAIGEKIGVLHTVVCFRLGLDAGGDTLAMCLLSGAVSLTLEARELLLDLRYFQNPPEMRVRLFEGELLPGLPYLRNALQYILRAPIGELLLGLPYLRNRAVVLCPLN